MLQFLYGTVITLEGFSTMYRYACTAYMLFAAGSIAWADGPSGPFLATVTSVLEGDVMVVETTGGPTTIRVFGVDCPDESQPGFEDALAFTRALVDGQELVFEPQGTDLSDRMVCEVVLPDGRNLSRELVRAGWAWRYKAHVKDDLVLTRMTFDAMESKRGLWAAAAPLAPWDFRGERAGDEIFFPYSDEPEVPEPVAIQRPRTIDLTATHDGASEKSVTFNPDGSRRLVLKGNKKASEADIAFIHNSNRILRDAAAQRAEEKRANAQAQQQAIQSRIQTGIENTEARRRTSNTRYGISGPVIITGGFGFPRVYISPWQHVKSTPDPDDADLWPYVRKP